MPYATGDGGGSSSTAAGPSLSTLIRAAQQRQSPDINQLLQQFLAQQGSQQPNSAGPSFSDLVNGANARPTGPGSNYSSTLMDLVNRPIQPHPEYTPNAAVAQGGDVAGEAEQAQKQSALEALLGQLPGLIGTGMSSTDYEEALKQSNAAINQGFNAQINAIRGASGHAEKTTKANNKKIEAMYRALSNDYSASADREIGRSDKYATRLKNVANWSKSAVQGNADQILDQQAALAQGLGVESALPQVQSAQADQVHKQIANIVKTGDRDLKTSIKGSQNQQEYLDREGMNAEYSGKERQTDLIGQLDAYLQGNEGKIADLKGALGQALASNQAQLGSAMSSQNDKAFSQSLDLAKFLESVSQDNKPKEQADILSSLLGKDDQLADLFNSQTGNPTLLNDLFLHPEFRNQQYTPHGSDHALKMNPAEAYARAMDFGKKNGLTGSQLTAFAMAAMQKEKGL